MGSRLWVALIGGPMYDALYEGFRDEVEVVGRDGAADG